MSRPIASFAGPLAVALLALLAMPGCKSTATASGPVSSASAASSGASPAAAASAPAAGDPSSTVPTPSLSVPGTHKPVLIYQVSSPVSTLVVTTHVGNVTINGSAGSGVSIVQQVGYSGSQPTLTHSVSGQTLTVGYSCSFQLVCGVAYVITVPRTVNVQISTGTGAVRLSGLGGHVSVQVDAGFIDASGMSSAVASFSTGAGGIDAAFTAAPAALSATTKAGAVTLHVPSTATYQVSAHTYLGKTTISVPQATSASRTITATSDIGSVSIAPAQ
jgi:hypothetical protein